MRGNIVIVGSSGHARVVLDIVEKQGLYTISGFIDSYRPAGETESGYPILGDESLLPGLVADGELDGFIVAIGDNHIRQKVTDRIAAICPTLPLVAAVHPSANIGRGVVIGPGTVVMAGASVNPASTIGVGCILNTHCSLDHDSAIGDFASLAPASATGGNCKIAAGAAVGIGATLVHGISVGTHTIVGAGATVLRDLPAQVVAYGTPAKVVSERAVGDRYL